ncbi:MAG: hypothetical protein R6U37_01605 [Dehalococcoidia bacterium]
MTLDSSLAFGRDSPHPFFLRLRGHCLAISPSLLASAAAAVENKMPPILKKPAAAEMIITLILLFNLPP